MPTRKTDQESDIQKGLSLSGALRDCLAGGVLVLDGRGKIESCTLEAGRLLRHGSSKCSRKPAALPRPIRELIRDSNSTGKPALNKVVSLAARGRNSSLIQASAVPIGSGNSRKTVVMVHDFGIARRLEDNLHRLDRLASIGTLSASMGHEVKNALVAVQTFVDLLLEKNHDTELTEVVRREMGRIHSILSQMLKFVGPGRRVFSVVHLHQVLEHSLRMVQHQLEGKLISLHRSFKAAPDALKGDAYQLEQAFLNLFINAAEAIGTNGSLTVTTEVLSAGTAASRLRRRQPHLCVTVADTGIGITSANMSRLFEPFFTTKHHGTGLGLSIARRIIREHNGDITVQSEMNKGTTFTILLPANIGTH